MMKEYGMFEILEQMKSGATDEHIAKQMKQHPDAYGSRREERLAIAREYRRALGHQIMKAQALGG